VLLGDLTGDIDLSSDGILINGRPVTPPRSAPGDSAKLAALTFRIKSRIDALTPARPHTDQVINELQELLNVVEQP
jgi:hypothetical protein